MKKVFYILLIGAMAACAPKQQQQQQQQDVQNTPVDTTEQVAEQQPTAAESDCIMEDVLRLIPKDVLPENMRKLDLVDAIHQKAAGGDDSYEVRCDYAFYDRSEGECDYADIFLKSYPKTDGTHLVIYAYEGGCDCSAMIEHRAYIYSNGQLTETSWPFPEPKFDEFYNALSFYGAEKSHVNFAKNDGMPLYLPNKDGDIMCTWVACDYFDFLDWQRSITYTWNGEGFDKTYGEYRMVDNDHLGGIKIGGPMPKTLDGFRLETLEQDEYYGDVMLIDASTGENVAKIQYFNEEGVQSINYIELYSKRYATYNGIKVGDMIDEVLKMTTESSAYDFSDGKAEDDTTRWIYVQNFYGLFAVEGHTIEVGTPYTSPDGDLNPYLGSDLKAATPSEPIKAIEMMKVTSEE